MNIPFNIRKYMKFINLVSLKYMKFINLVFFFFLLAKFQVGILRFKLQPLHIAIHCPYQLSYVYNFYPFNSRDKLMGFINLMTKLRIY